MPRVFRKAKTRIGNYGPEYRDVLERGGPCIGRNPAEFFDRNGNENIENIFEAWKAGKADIQAAWKTLGKRPWAWWLFDSPEPRDRDLDESEQLDRLGLLGADELASLTAEARDANRRLYANPWSNGGLPFRRNWAFWRFLQDRDPSMTEAEQLIEMDLLTDYEKAIQAEPRKALAGGVGCIRSRFHYLTGEELDLLKLHSPTLRPGRKH